MGFFKNGLIHGYGKKYNSFAVDKEGLFEYGEYRAEKGDVKTYDPSSHSIAKKVDLYKYLTKEFI